MRLLDGSHSVLGLPLLAVVAWAQGPIPLLLEGEPLPGVGTVTRVEGVRVVDGGRWLVLADTDFPDSALDGVVILDGALHAREGDALADPPNTAIRFFVDAALTPGGTALLSHFITGTGSFDDDHGLFLGGRMLLREGAPALDPSWWPGTIWSYFSGVDAIGDDLLLVRGYVDDPLVPGLLDDFIGLVRLDASGAVQSTTSLVRKDDALPGEIYPVKSLRFGRDRMGFDSAGNVLCALALDTGSPFTIGDTQVWLFGAQGAMRIAREGDPSPVPGRNWGSLGSPGLSLSDSGAWTLRDRLDDSDLATDEIIVKSGAKLVQEGDLLPVLGGHALRGFGQGRAHLDAAGRALWYGEWNDPDPSRDSGLFLDHALIVREGMTRVGSTLLGAIESSADSHAISPDGRWVAFIARLRTGERGAFLLDLEHPVRPLCDGAGYGAACPCANVGAPGAGCADGPGRPGALLGGSGQPSLSADSFALEVSGLRRASPVVLFQGSSVQNGGAGLPFGDGLLCVGGRVRVLAASVASRGLVGFGHGYGASLAQLGAPFGPGTTVVYQALYRSASAVCTSAGLNLSNALLVVWGP